MKSLKLNLYDTITLCIERTLDETGQLHRMIRKCQTDSGIIFSLFSMCDALGSSDISPEVYVQSDNISFPCLVAVLKEEARSAPISVSFICIISELGNVDVCIHTKIQLHQTKSE